MKQYLKGEGSHLDLHPLFYRWQFNDWVICDAPSRLVVAPRWTTPLGGPVHSPIVILYLPTL